MKFARILFSFLFFIYISLFSSTRNYITGNGFKACADFIVENDSVQFDPIIIPTKSIIYIETHGLAFFFEHIFPQIKSPIILITHNSDHPAPGKFVHYLNDERIIRWYGQNCDVIHPKFFPIPIGIANAKWVHGNTYIFDQVLDQLEAKKQKKSSRLYVNFSATNSMRPYLYSLFQDKPFVKMGSQKPLREYLLQMAHYRFVLSPFGNGLDCHRTWEALLVDSIPVVQTSTLDPLYEDLPVIIVQDWSQITPEFLQEQYYKLKQKKYLREKLFMDYWVKLIHDFRSSL